jgi:hypothetical protein
LERYGHQKQKQEEFNAIIKDRIYQFNGVIPNDDCECDMQATRTSSNTTKHGSAVKPKSLQKKRKLNNGRLAKTLTI